MDTITNKGGIYLDRSMISKRKVSIIGAGYVGASIAYALTIKNLVQEIIFIDVNMKKANGEALDIQYGIPYMGDPSVRVGDYPDCENCDLIIITAGRNRRQGESILDMIADNVRILKAWLIRLKSIIHVVLSWLSQIRWIF